MRVTGGILCLFGLLIGAYGVWAETTFQALRHAPVVCWSRNWPHPEKLIAVLLDMMARPGVDPAKLAAGLEWILYAIIALGVVLVAGGVAMMVTASHGRSSES